jgi:hypothetical protein
MNKTLKIILILAAALILIVVGAFSIAAMFSSPASIIISLLFGYLVGLKTRQIIEEINYLGE